MNSDSIFGKIEGVEPLSRDENNNFKYRIATIFFPENGAVMYSSSMPHFLISKFYIDEINRDLQLRKLPELTSKDEQKILKESVELIMVEDSVLLRTKPDNMNYVLQADGYLQKNGVPKFKIHFIQTDYEEVRKIIRSRGEIYRLQAMPVIESEIKSFIRKSRITLGGSVFYYYAYKTGIKYLTYHEFARLENLSPQALRKAMCEIKLLSSLANENNKPEVVFFMAETLNPSIFLQKDFEYEEDKQIIERFYAMKRGFYNAVTKDLREDNLENPIWRNEIFKRLARKKGAGNESPPEESRIGLAREFYTRIIWLPCGIIREGKFFADPVISDIYKSEEPDMKRQVEPKVLEIFRNYRAMRPEIEHINIGKVESSISKRHSKNLVMPGRREVFVACVKYRGNEEIIRFLRWQKRDVYYFLDQGMDIDAAEEKSAVYLDNVLKRYKACGILGLNMLTVEPGSVRETYLGKNLKYKGAIITTCYFERDYVFGYATDKIPGEYYGSMNFVEELGRLLGETAAANIIAGRYYNGGVLFDDGDEILVLENGMPRTIIVTDVTASFNECELPLTEFTTDYLQPVYDREELLNENINLFRDKYISAFINKFKEIQNRFRQEKKLFLNLFADNTVNHEFNDKWLRILKKLDETDADELAEQMIGG